MCRSLAILMRNIFVTFSLLAAMSLSADQVMIKKDKTVIDNVKTSTISKTETQVEFKDGTKQVFKTNAISVVSAPVVWEEPVKEEPGFFASLFGNSKDEKPQDNTEKKQSEIVSTTGDKAPNESEAKEEKGFLAKWFPEITMGTMAVLWLVLP